MNHRHPLSSAPDWFSPAWLLLAATALLWGLGDFALIDPDEGRNATTALEMAASGDYLLPSINGTTYIDKPFLFFAAASVCLDLFGRSEFGARLAPCVFTWGSIALVAWFAAGLFGRRAAWVAGVALATMPLAIAFARTVIFDSTLAFFVTLATIAFYRGIESRADPNVRFARRWIALAWAAIALGVFTKGPVALLLPLLVALPYGLWRRQARALWHPAGWGSFLALVVPWLWLTEAALPGFLHYSLVIETWQRTTSDTLRRTGPIWYFLPYVIGGAFPWVFIALTGGSRRDGRGGAPLGGHPVGYGRDHRVVFLLLWLLLPLLFFSLSQSKRPQYILPLMPALALLAAYAWDDDMARRRGARLAAAGWFLLGGLLLVATTDLVPMRQRLDAELADSIVTTARALGALALLSGIAAWFVAPRRRATMVTLSLPLIALPLIAGPLLGAVAEGRSARALAATLESELAAGGSIIGIETFPPSLPFYLGRPITLGSADGSQLTSNYITYKYPEIVDQPGGTLRSPGWWHDALVTCSAPHLFILRPRHGDTRAVLEAAGLPPLFAHRKLLAYGPCRGGSATDHPLGDAPPSEPTETSE